MKDNFFANLKDLKDEMLKILGEVSTLTPTFSMSKHDEIWQPRCDIFESKDYLFIIVDLAGIDKKSLGISTTDEYVRIYGTRKIAVCDDNVYYHSMEIESGNFERKIYFPDSHIESKTPEVVYENGFLHLKFKIKEVKEEVIMINID